MPRTPFLHWFSLSPRARWLVTALLVAGLGVVGCVNLSMTPPSNASKATSRKEASGRSTVNAQRGKPADIARTWQSKTGTNKSLPNQTIAKSTPRVSPPVPGTAFSPAKKSQPSEYLKTPFDPPAEERNTIVQAGGWGNLRNKFVVNAASKSSSDPFLELESQPSTKEAPTGSTGEAPAALPAPGLTSATPRGTAAVASKPPKAPSKIRRTDTRDLADDDEFDSPGLKVTPPPIPPSRSQTRKAMPTPEVPLYASDADEGEEIPSRPLAGEIRERPKATANRPIRKGSAAARPPVAAKKVVEPLPSPTGEGDEEWQASTARVEKPKPRRLLNLKSNVPPLEAPPQVAEAPIETPKVELLPEPPETETLVGRYPTPKLPADVDDAWDVAAPPKRDTRLAKSFSEATGSERAPVVEEVPLPEMPAPKSRRTPATMATRTKTRGVKGTTAKTTQKKNFEGPIIRPARREDEPTANVANSSPRYDTTGLQKTIEAADPSSSHASIPAVPAHQPVWKAPVTLQGVIADEDTSTPTRQQIAQRVLSMPADIGDSIPSSVPPPPNMNAASAQISLPKIGQGEYDSAPPFPVLPPTIDAAPAPPLPQAKPFPGMENATASADSEGQPRFDEEVEANLTSPSSSSISQTSLIGLCVGLTGLCGLLLWRFLERRSHRERRDRQNLQKSALAAVSIVSDSEEEPAVTRLSIADATAQSNQRRAA